MISNLFNKLYLGMAALGVLITSYFLIKRKGKEEAKEEHQQEQLRSINDAYQKAKEAEDSIKHLSTSDRNDRMRKYYRD